MDDDVRARLDGLRITDDTDLRTMWELLVAPLGFERRSLWFALVGGDRRPLRFLVEVDDLPPTPSDEDADALFAVLAQLLGGEARGSSVALLLSRPGRDGLRGLDRDLAACFRASARRWSVPCETVHVATDLAVLAVPVDDLAA